MPATRRRGSTTSWFPTPSTAAGAWSCAATERRCSAGWRERGEMCDPPAPAGATLLNMRAYLDSLPPAEQEEARLLRWGAIVAHGRSIPMADQSDGKRNAPNCSTFQPDRAARAVRVGEIREFSHGGAEPL